ncbi:MAG: PQQ-binding-like beta-propeller repeat protein [Phycisphaerae bacterium]|nr:PQQ-like beta-propeller repeat protein [Phycisphaerae bacterium]NIP50769.1 PQQ-like beta-propeller repeat protein [Phycisphaerae bacterium]NIS49933.1 PQQ-like beta-propeller repeat protein [Phycisphaerae bacterium]NIU07637.1 PQQ-like beta-propeller repeat protein [Phycisphaerae bacterium]NIU57419.1 PQQ-binding-like beta-propeller repeat protein [Phycisphaerae bacterium]
MKTQIDDNYKEPSMKTKVTNQWYNTAYVTAVIGGVFSLIVLQFMLFNYFQRTYAEPKRTEKWEALKVQLRQPLNDQQLISHIQELDSKSIVDPNRAKEFDILKTQIRDNIEDEQLLSRVRQLFLQIRQDEIRQLDLKIRKLRIRRWDFSQKGSYLLLGSVVVFLIGLKTTSAYKKKLPAPQPAPDKRKEQARKAILSRWAVTITTVTFGSTALFLVTRPWIDFSTADMLATPYPSMAEIKKNWPRFRGPGGLGISAYTNIPTNWNGKTGEGILWKSEIPLPGHNSPIVWEDRVFVTGADKNNREVYCFDALTGDLLWKRGVTGVQQDEPLELMEEGGPAYAAPTAVTDGRRVYAIFPTGDVACFNFEGRKVWTKNLGLPDSGYGYATSLEMYRNLLLIQYDQGGYAEDEMSRLIALDTFTGRSVWETKRPVPNSWSSPIVAEIGNQPQIITCADPWVIAYEPNGTEIWRAKCLGGEIAPSPIYAAGKIFVVEPYATLVAIKPDGRGDVTKTHIDWSIEENTPDTSCPVGNENFVFLVTTEGMLTCYKTEDGSKVWEKDLLMNFLASPSLVGDRLYLLSEEGVMLIAEISTEYKEVAKCELGEHCLASPAFMDGRIYIRGFKNLYCIGDKASPEQP